MLYKNIRRENHVMLTIHIPGEKQKQILQLFSSTALSKNTVSL